MILEKTAIQSVYLRRKYGIQQFCITFMRIFAHWLNAKLRIRETPEGCRAIPSGHYNFDPALAREFGGRDGYTKAIIFQYVANWVVYNQEHGKNYVDGRFWSYNSGRAWAAMIDLWDTNTVEKHIKFLRDEGILDAKAMKAHQGDQTLWFTIPQKESNGRTQIALPLDSKSPTLGAKEPNDSSVSQAPTAPSSVSKPQQQQQPRAFAHLDAGGVAQFPKRDLDPKEGEDHKAEMPEAHDLKDSQDGSREDQAPSPAVPEWMPNFFTGCAESELVQLLHTFGEPLLLAAKTYGEKARNNIDNPPGFVRVQLAKGWRPPVEAEARSYLQSWMISADECMASETTEHLQWIISDECDWLPMHKSIARDELAARQAGAR